MPANRSVEAEVCVIGAGIMGLSASWELTKRGISTLCLDRGKPGAEASGSNAGTLAIQNKRLESIHLALQAVRRWKTLSAELESNLEYEQRGGYRVAHKSDQVRALESAVRAQQKLGVQVEMVYPPQLFKRAPFLSREILAASYCGDDGMANPFLATRAYVAACRRAGVAFEFDTPVESIHPKPDGSFSVRAAGLDAVCRVVVVAAGAWIPHLCRPLGIELPLYTKIQQVMITTPAPPLFPTIVTHIGGRLTVKQQPQVGKVLIGGGWIGEGSETHHRLRRESVAGNLALALRIIPALARTRLLRAWTGAEGRSPDRLPVVGSVGKPAGLYVLGCAAGGFTLAPACGELLAARVAGGDSLLSSAGVSASRFLRGREAGGPQGMCKSSGDDTRL